MINDDAFHTAGYIYIIANGIQGLKLRLREIDIKVNLRNRNLVSAFLTAENERTDY